MRTIKMMSCVVPVFNEGINLKSFLMQLSDYIKNLSINYQIIVIDDGSTDGSFEICKTLDLNIKAIKFSRNFGKEYALTAGIDFADGDVTLIIDSDFQHPFDAIPAFIKKWEEGADIVYGVQKQNKYRSIVRSFLSNCFYKMLSIGSSCDIPAHAGDFRLIDKKAIKHLKTLKERTRFFKGLYAWVGFKSSPVYFSAHKRISGDTKFNPKKLLELALNGITAFSDLPLRIWLFLGSFIAICSFLYAIWIFLATILFGKDLNGWPTLSVGLFFLSGVQLISIGVLGEYISKIFHEVKQRPLYIIEEVYDSKIDEKIYLEQTIY